MFAVKEKTPGFPGFYPPGVFGSPGDLGSSQYRLTAQHGTAGSIKENFPIFHHQKFNRQFSHQNGIVVRVVSALWGGVWVKCDLRCFGGRRKKVIFTRPAVPHLISKRYRL